jgi:hypothetical protein
LRIFHKLRLSTLGVLPVLVGALSSLFRARTAFQLENLALRHQIGVLLRSVRKRPKLTAADRIPWAWLCGIRSHWRSVLVIVKPETVIAWHQRQISGARHVAEPSRRNLAADLPRAFEPPSLSAGSVPAADGVCDTHQERNDEFDHERMVVTCRNGASASQRLRTASR